MRTQHGAGWFRAAWVTKKMSGEHFVAISTNEAAMDAFGIPADHRFAMWDWVGGRYSVTSAVGLPVAMAVGMDNFRKIAGRRTRGRRAFSGCAAGG